MTISPSNSSNPSPVSSPSSPPYNPLSTPQPSGIDTHSIFYSGPSTSSGIEANDGEQPCCSHTITPSTSSSTAASTSAAVKKAVKRKRDDSSSSEGTSEATEHPHKKCKRKTRHLERPKSTSSQHPAKRRPRIPRPESSLIDLFSFKEKLNNRFLCKLQKELTAAMQTLSPEEVTAAKVWDIISQSASSSGRLPIILFKRNQGFISRLDWNKLKRALSLLNIHTPQGPDCLGIQAAKQATKWLTHFFRSLHTEARPRHRMFGTTFTHLCGQALIAQNAHIDASAITPLTQQEHRTNFLSTDDLNEAIAHPDADTMAAESAVVFLRHYDDPTNLEDPSPMCQYPIKDFETGKSFPEEAKASTSTEQK